MRKRKPDWHRFITDLQRLEGEARALGLHVTARAINGATQAAGWEYGDDAERAAAAVREHAGASKP